VFVQALCPEWTVEGFDERVVSGFARAKKIQSDALRIGPKVYIARDELRALIDADRLRVADIRAYALQRLRNILSPAAKARVDDRREARERVDDREHSDLPAGRQLVVDEVHRPRLVRLARRLSVIAELRFDAPLRRLFAQLEAKLIVDAVSLLDVNVPAIAAQQHMHAAEAVAHTRRADLLDARFEAGPIGATGLAVVAGCVELDHAASPPDRNVPVLANPYRQLALAIRPQSFRRMTS